MGSSTDVKAELTDIIQLFRQGSDSITQYLAEQKREDLPMQLAFDEIEPFFLFADTLQQGLDDPEKRAYFNQQANEVIRLLDKLLVYTSQLQHQASFTSFEGCLFLFSLWFAEHDGKIIALVPVVNILAARSNNTFGQTEVIQMFHTLETIIKATDDSISEDMNDRDPRRPWRVLLLNYAITATRTHEESLMDQAFELLIANLPDDSKQFFTEGMGQMTAQDYPDPVRMVMEKYYKRYAMEEIKKN
jgi:hypothetical protein